MLASSHCLSACTAQKLLATNSRLSTAVLKNLHMLQLRQIANFHTARAAIEDEYSRKMLSLCRKPLGSSEAGTLRVSLDVMRGEVESMGKAHQGIASQMKSELEEPLTAFAGGMKERRKIVQTGVEKLFKLKQQQTQAVNKVGRAKVFKLSRG